jgi:thioredoxin 1
MSQSYRIIGGVLVVAALGGVAWLKTRPRDVPTTVNNVPCPECALPPAMAGSGEPAPPIPTGSGLPCLVEFGSDECQACKKMVSVLAEAEPRLKGRADLLRVDTDDHPQAAQGWNLRMIPTQVAVSADGKELWRHEGFIPIDELLAELTRVGIECPGAGESTAES